MLKKRFFGIMIMSFCVMLIFSLVGCELNSDDYPLNGTWIEANEYWMYVFNEDDWTLLSKSGSTYVNYQKGTFSLNASKTKFTIYGTHEWRNGSWVANTFENGIVDIEISDNSFTMTNTGSGWGNGLWTETYTRQ